MNKKAMLQGRCPRCRQGKIFRGVWRMNKKCPICDIQFEREEGFFLMSIYMAYAFDCAIIFPLLVIFVLQGRTIEWIVTVCSIILIIIAPITLRLTRIVWIYLDEWMDPVKQKNSNN